MSLRANNNIAAINVQHNIGRNSMQLHSQLERLSSGLKVNRARDDAAQSSRIGRVTGRVVGA